MGDAIFDLSDPNVHATGTGHRIKVIRVFDRWGWLIRSSRNGYIWASGVPYEDGMEAIQQARHYLRNHILLNKPLP